MSTDSTTLKKALDSEKHCDGALLELQALLSRLVKLKKHITAQRNFITDVVKSNITTSTTSHPAKDNVIDYRVNEYKHDGIYFDISTDANVLSDVSTDSNVFRDTQKYSDPTLIEDAKETGYDMEEVRKLLASLNALIGAPNDTVSSITDATDNPAVSISDGVYDTTKILERAIYFLKSAFLSSDIGKYGYDATDTYINKKKHIPLPFFSPKSLTANNNHNVHGKYNIECTNTVIVWRAIYSSLHSLNNMRFIEKAFPLNGTFNTDITVQLEHLFNEILTTKDDSDLDRWVCKNWAGQFKRDVLFNEQGGLVTGYNTPDHFRSIPVSFLGKYALTTKSVYIVGKGDSAKFSPNTLTIQEGDTVTWHHSGTDSAHKITYDWATNVDDNIIDNTGGVKSDYVFNAIPNDKYQTVTSGIFLTKHTYEYNLGTTSTVGTIKVLSKEEYDIHMDKKMTEAASELALMFIYGGYRSGIYNHIANSGITAAANSELFLQTSTTKPRYKADLNVIKSLIGYDASGNKGLEDVGITIPPLQPFADAPDKDGISTGSIKVQRFSFRNKDPASNNLGMGEITFATDHGLHTGDIVSLQLVDGEMPTGFVSAISNDTTTPSTLNEINRIVINIHGRSTYANTYMVHRVNDTKLTLHDYVGIKSSALGYLGTERIPDGGTVTCDILRIKYNICLMQLLTNMNIIDATDTPNTNTLYKGTQLITWAQLTDDFASDPTSLKTDIDLYGRTTINKNYISIDESNPQFSSGVVYIRKLGNGLTQPEQLLSTDSLYANNLSANKLLLNRAVMVGGNDLTATTISGSGVGGLQNVLDHANLLTLNILNPENKRKRDEPDKNPVLLSLFWPIQKYYKTILTELQNLNLKHQIIEGDVLKHRYNNSGITPNMIVRELIYQSEDATNERVQSLILDKPTNEPLLSKMVNANGTTASVIFSRHYNVSSSDGKINTGTGTATDVHIYTSKQHYKDMYNDKSSPGTGLIESAGITININAIDTRAAAEQQPLSSLIDVSGNSWEYLIDKVAINVYDPVKKKVISGISDVINDVEIDKLRLNNEGTKLTGIAVGDIPDIPLYANQYLPIILRIGDANITSNSVYIRLFILYAPVASGTTDYPLWDLLADGTTVPVQLGSDVQSNVRNIYTNIQYKLSIDGTNGHIVLNNDQNSFIDEHTNSNDCYTVTKSSKVDYTISNGVIQDDALLTAYQVGTKIVDRWQVVRFNSLIKQGTTELPRIMRIKITGSGVHLARLEDTTNINTPSNLSLVDSSVMTPTFELQTPDVTGGTLTTLGLYANTEVTRASDEYLWTGSTTIASKIKNPFKMVISQSGLDSCADIINDISTVEMKTKLQKAYTQFKNDAGRNTAGIRGLDIN